MNVKNTKDALVSLERPLHVVLASPQRQQIMALVTAQPGVPLGELMGRLDMGWGTIYHHVRIMTRAGLLRTETVGRRRLVFPCRWSREADAVPYGLLKGRSARRIARSIIARPDQSVLDVCESTGESPRVVYYHVRRLIEAELLVSSSPTRRMGLRGTPKLEEILDVLGDTDDEPDVVTIAGAAQGAAQETTPGGGSESLIGSTPP